MILGRSLFYSVCHGQSYVKTEMRIQCKAKSMFPRRNIKTCVAQED